MICSEASMSNYEIANVPIFATKGKPPLSILRQATTNLHKMAK